jgi:hypothetical protein
MTWRTSGETLITWGSAKNGDKVQLGKDTIKFSDFTASNCDIVSRNVSGIYLRFQLIEFGDNQLGFAANLLSSGWAIFGEGTKDDSLANKYASTLIG